MENDRRLELIDHAIQKHIHDNTNKAHESDQSHDTDRQYQNVSSHLPSVSQLKMLKGDEILEQCEASSTYEPEASVIQKTEGENKDAEGSENDEIMKELKKVKRQNFITHCLLSVMIVLTVTWQLSEVSLILRMKEGLSHPFRSFGNMLKGMVKVPELKVQEGDDKEHSPESSSPTLGIPDLSHNGLTGNE